MTAHWEDHLADLRRICFDTNVLIYLLESLEPRASYVRRAFTLLELGQGTGVVSTVVEMELLVRPLQVGDVQACDSIELFFRNRPGLVIRSVDRRVARRAADLCARGVLDQRQANDAIIVATALEENCDVIITNDSQLERKLRETGTIRCLYLDGYIQ